MRNTMLRAALPCLFAALTFGCSETPERELAGAQNARPLAVDNGLFYTFDDSDGEGSPDVGQGLTLALDLSGEEPRVVEHSLPAGRTSAQARPGRPGDVVVLTSGHDQYREGDRLVPAENGHLLVFNREGPPLDVPLGASFNRFVLSDDGRFAVAYGPSGNQAALNSIEVVDLDRSASEPQPVSSLVTLGFDGRAPQNLVFSPAASFTRRLLAVVFPDAIQLLDLQNPEAGEISVALKEAADARTLQPQKLLFVREAGLGANTAERIYIQSAGSREVMVLTLLDAPDTAQGFRPAPSYNTAASAITDMATIGAGDGFRVLAVASGLEIIDPKIGESVRVAGGSSFTSLLSYQGRSPVDTQLGERALLYGPGLPQVGFADVEGESAWSSRAVELVELGEPLTALIPLSKHKIALALHSGQRISIIDLEQRRVVPIQLESMLASYAIDETDLHARLWTANRSGIVGVLDLLTLRRTPLPVVLEWSPVDAEDSSPVAQQQAGALVLIPGATRKMALVHQSRAGFITLVNADFNPDDAEATLDPRELLGFFLNGLLD